MRGGAQRGLALGNLGLIENGAVLVQDGIIQEVGSSDAMLRKHPSEDKFDASGFVVLPGLVDPHTHAVWVGDRAREFEMRLQGKSYLEIMEAGGGIVSTVKAVRQSNVAQIVSESRSRLRTMFEHGTTTAEVKTGYGLSLDAELRLLEAILILDETEAIDLIPTFLGAHAVPPEFKNDVDGYTRLVCDEMLPGVKKWWQKNAGSRKLPFVDVFCETGAFNLAQSRRILETAKQLGFPLKIHADEFDNLGGASLAAELHAASADHLVVTSSSDIEALGNSETVAVSLPCTPFGLAEKEYSPAQEMLEKGVTLAIATDINPGTAWCENMQFAIALACRYLKLTPAQAIAAATINAAFAISQNQRVGSIEPGKQADLVLFDIPDYRHLGYRFGVNLAHTVIKKGKIYPIRGYDD